MSGYGITVQTDTGHSVWVTETGTSTQKRQAMKFDSEAGAEAYRAMLAGANPGARLTVRKL